MVPKGATIRHAKTLFLDCKIPMPNHNADNTIKFVELLTQAIINKEKLIRERHEAILNSIETELLENQKPNKFKFELPNIKEIENIGRLDTNLYREHFKKIVFQIENYKNGIQTIQELGFSLSRGQNLQVSNIGDSIYSKKKYNKFYTLMLPKFLSKYGTVDKIEYLGNPNSLKTLQKGDLIFGAEGFEKGRSIVIIEEQDRVITNIHGITIQQEEHNVNKAIFIKCFLDYLRSKGLIDLYAVGGNGGSLAQKYWDIIPFPKFDKTKQDEIALLYHNPNSNYQADTFSLDNFLEQDNAFNETAGIYELDKTAKQLKEILNKAIDDIANDREVNINFTV
jgi:type I restriction enzyme S subunit